MKTRSSFVSNSSSSSFLVLAHGRDDFKCFDQFEGHGYFIVDYDLEMKSGRNPVNAILSFLKRIVRDEIRDTAGRVREELLHRDDRFVYDMWPRCTLSDVVDKCREFHGISEPKELYQKLVDANNRLYDRRDAIWKETDADLRYDDKRLAELYDLADKESKAICGDPLLKEYAEQIATELPQSCLLEYSDETSMPGSYMEHHFMPFMSQNPEIHQEFSIFSVSNH